jgi:hypothetical protein
MLCGLDLIPKSGQPGICRRDLKSVKKMIENKNIFQKISVSDHGIQKSLQPEQIMCF